MISTDVIKDCMCILYEYITNIFDLSSRGLTLGFCSMCCHNAVAPVHVVSSRMNLQNVVYTDGLFSRKHDGKSFVVIILIKEQLK